MNRYTLAVAASAIALAALASGGCAEALDPDIECAPGRSQDARDSHLCVYEGAATIETGFVCPDGHPFAFEMEGGMICSDSPEPPDVVIDVPMRPDEPRGSSGSSRSGGNGQSDRGNSSGNAGSGGDSPGASGSSAGGASSRDDDDGEVEDEGEHEELEDEDEGAEREHEEDEHEELEDDDEDSEHELDEREEDELEHAFDGEVSDGLPGL